MEFNCAKKLPINLFEQHPKIYFHLNYSDTRSLKLISTLYEGELKRVLVPVTGLEPERQRLIFRGKEKRDDEPLHASGAKDGAKVLLLENQFPANVEQKAEPVMMDESMMRACEAVVRVRSEVDKLSAKVKELYL
jgi:hypothetical protein